jgi:hypothetical protein
MLPIVPPDRTYIDGIFRSENVLIEFGIPEIAEVHDRANSKSPYWPMMLFELLT